MDLGLEDLTRLAFCEASRELSDLARAQVPIYDDHLRAGELLAEALRLRAGADEAIRLAVAFERARGSSWEDIGAALDASRQAAHERYARAVGDIHESILFPWREGEHGMPGWWACPAGLEDPESTAAALDDWVARHRETTDPDRGDKAVSGGLGGRHDRDALDALRRTIDVADRLVDRTLPAGVSERSARRLLLEAKVRAYDAIAARDTGVRRRDALRIAGEAFEQLVAWHRADVRERLGHVAYSDSEVFITLDGRPLSWLAHSDDPVDDEARGWFVWGLGDQSSSEPLTEPQPPPAVLHAALRVLGVATDGELVGDVDADRTAATARALDLVCEQIATDAAKGVAPFGRSGIAGPQAAS